jgi:hypothetical protein
VGIELHIRRIPWSARSTIHSTVWCFALGLVLVLPRWLGGFEEPSQKKLETDFKEIVHPLLEKYCTGCHSSEKKRGELELERFSTIGGVRSDLKPCDALKIDRSFLAMI